MKKARLSDRFRYFFDNQMSRGPAALIIWLLLLSIGLILLGTVFIMLSGADPVHSDGTPMNFAETAWLGFLHTVDSGSLGNDNPDGNLLFLLAMIFITFGGIFIFSTFIGVLSTGIQSKLEDLRKGRSVVLENDHTVILGWSPQIFTIISELVIANASRKRACIAILAPNDKVEMEEEIRNRVGKTGHTRVVCRTGSPIDLSDLAIVNPNGARSIIILADETENPDSHVIKTLLALINNPERRSEPYHIVAEINEPRNYEVAQMVGRDQVKLIMMDQLISRIMVQTSRQSGLSVLYQELLDFDGDEIYFAAEPQLVGKTFRDALSAYHKCSAIGLRTATGVALNPPQETVIAPGDQVILIAEDDSVIEWSPATQVATHSDAIQLSPHRQPAPERTLILGWNSHGATVVNELDAYVTAGSEITVVASSPDAQAAIEQGCSALSKQTLTFQAGDTTDRRILDSLKVETYDHVITLSYSDTLDIQEADAQTLMTLLHLRDIQERTGQHVSVVSEILDVRNRELAEVTRADDFIVSNRLGSLMLAQVSENKDLMAVFDDLFDAGGSEFYLKPAEDYLKLGTPVTMYTILEAASRQNETAVGYRVAAEAGIVGKNYGFYINPEKGNSRTLSSGDQIIVLARE